MKRQEDKKSSKRPVKNKIIKKKPLVICPKIQKDDDDQEANQSQMIWSADGFHRENLFVLRMMIQHYLILFLQKDCVSAGWTIRLHVTRISRVGGLTSKCILCLDYY